MNGSIARTGWSTVQGLVLGLVLAIALGWATLVLGGRTDTAGRMGLALGAAMLAHFWMRLGRLP